MTPTSLAREVGVQCVWLV